MARLTNDPALFADEVAEGFVAAHGDRVRRVPGGVVRRRPLASGKVAVVVGGGSGHYPAFAGLVGTGLAAGAVMGNVFASPSAQQVRSVARAADRGAGVLLGYGNYAGDVLHFTEGAELLAADGVQVVSLAVTDDISSAPAERASERRGVAGDVAVFKIAGAAAEAGLDLATVLRLATRANERTRTFGVALSGCTLPGSSRPLFVVPAGRMGLGMGIHGEPGTGESDVPTADGLADLLVESVVSELPPGVAAADGQRAAVLLNGLGGIGHEELFLLYRRVAQRLEGLGVTVVDPEVGALVTSFDMQGVSLTLTWLDEELEACWRAPADSPAFRRGAPAPDQASGDAELLQDVDDDEGDGALGGVRELPRASSDSRAFAAEVAEVLQRVTHLIDAHAEELGRIDAVAGDGDHGIGMQRGTRAAAQAAAEAVARGAGAGSALALAGEAWADRAGGTSGALWGAVLREVGAVVGDERVPGVTTAAEAAAAAGAAVHRRGGAVVGDKTMVDALTPYVRVLQHAADLGSPVATALREAARAAQAGADGTAQLLPVKGRAKTHGERAVGTPDAGAVSLALIAGLVAEAVRPAPPAVPAQL
ncbi:dihydroxyacetone kinase family protein [Quadrisphaera setariae]|uniref:Dihydroxyacetone kinase family protein n=1 Tax=Quadrisphaera setariae TaxID=2593304 RepID=A0A5C8ZF19_9ACTN|nr:dihydroxyacetone kinase family protein [Quadrisphaera setariae]TXR55778.1 dihydroxyacetone kinase family protein [Quadrisphaera setariae]